MYYWATKRAKRSTHGLRNPHHIPFLSFSAVQHDLSILLRFLVSNASLLGRGEEEKNGLDRLRDEGEKVGVQAPDIDEGGVRRRETQRFGVRVEDCPSKATSACRK